MKILIFSQYYKPEQFLINDIAPELVRRGHQVTVLTGRPNYPQGFVFQGYEGHEREHEILDGVEVIRCPITPRGKGKVHLLLNYLSYLWLANKTAKKLDGLFDLVFLYQLTPITMAYPAIKYSKRNGVKLFCYCLDLAPLSGSGLTQSALLAPIVWLYKEFSRWAYRNCDSIAVTSESFIPYLAQTHEIPLSRMAYLPQHAPNSLLGADLKNDGNSMPVFMFAGNLGGGARIDHVIYAIDKLRSLGFSCRFDIVGDGSAKAMLISLVDRLKLNDCIVFYGHIPFAQMENAFRRADALVVTLRKGQITVPGKVQTYMATGKPIIGAMDGSGQQMIHEVKCGRCVDAEDVQGLVRIMREFIEHPGNFTDCGEMGRDYFLRHFLLSSYVDGLEGLMAKCDK